MRCLALVLVAAIIGFGCGDSKKEKFKKPVNARNGAPLFHYGNPVLLQYDQFVNQLDTEARSSGLQAVQQFQTLFKNQPPDVCDTAYYIFNNFHNQLSMFLNMNMEKDSINYEDLLDGEVDGHKPVLSKKQKAIARSLATNGFSLNAEEGGTYIEQNQHFIIEHFSKKLSPAMRQYLVQLSKEQKEGLDDDGGLTVSPEQLVDRTIWYEQFTKANPHFLFAERAQNYYKVLLYILMTGDDNTPVREYDSVGKPLDSLTEYYYTAYSRLQSKYAQTNANTIINPYFVAFQKRDTAEVSKLLNTFQKEYGFNQY